MQVVLGHPKPCNALNSHALSLTYFPNTCPCTSDDAVDALIRIYTYTALGTETYQQIHVQAYTRITMYSNMLTSYHAYIFGAIRNTNFHSQVPELMVSHRRRVVHPDQPGLEKELAACHEARCVFDPRKCPPVNHYGIMVVLVMYTCESTTAESSTDRLHPGDIGMI